MTSPHFKHTCRHAGSWLSAAVALVWVSQVAMGHLAALPMVQALPDVFTDAELWNAGGLLVGEIVRLEGAELAAAAGRGLLIAATASILLLIPRFVLYRAARRWSATPASTRRHHSHDGLPGLVASPTSTHGKHAETPIGPGTHVGPFLRFCSFWAIQVLFAVVLAVLAWMTRRLSLELGWHGLAPSLTIASGFALLLLLTVTWLEVGRLDVCLGGRSRSWVHALARAAGAIKRAPHLLALRGLKTATALAMSSAIAQSGSAASLVTPRQIAVAQAASLLLVILDALWLVHAAGRLPPERWPPQPGEELRDCVTRDPQAAAMT